jgi:hypothetical protein
MLRGKAAASSASAAGESAYSGAPKTISSVRSESSAVGKAADQPASKPWEKV